jgi:hypothetical protein
VGVVNIAASVQAITIIELWPHDEGDCPMCGQWRTLSHSVGWCCEPTRDDIGTMSKTYPGIEVGGRTVCKSCHDQFYAA